MDELQQAHKDYEERKKKIIHNLEMLHDNIFNMTIRQILDEAIEFIKEREI